MQGTCLLVQGGDRKRGGTLCCAEDRIAHLLPQFRHVGEALLDALVHGADRSIRLHRFAVGLFYRDLVCGGAHQKQHRSGPGFLDLRAGKARGSGGDQPGLLRHSGKIQGAGLDSIAHQGADG